MIKYLASIALIGTIALGPSLAHAWAVPADLAASTIQLPAHLALNTADRRREAIFGA